MTLRAVDTCTLCRGSGWLLQSEGDTSAVKPCPECRQHMRSSHLLDRAEIPPRYLERGFDVYSIHHPLQDKALRHSIQYIETFPNVPRGLLFVGPCGVGKTHLSVAILKGLIEEKGISARFVDEAELLRRLQYSYDRDSPETEKEVLLPLMNADLIVWDDLGTGRPTEWVRETIRTVINHRYTYNKQTIFSTNWNLPAAASAEKRSSRSDWTGMEIKTQETLAERIGQRLFSRILEMCEIIEVQGPDARLEIHKAGRDFEAAAPKKRSTRSLADQISIPAGLLRCPRCDANKVEQRDQSKRRKLNGEAYVDLFCRCDPCAEHFIARFFVNSARIEYPAFS